MKTNFYTKILIALLIVAILPSCGKEEKIECQPSVNDDCNIAEPKAKRLFETCSDFPKAFYYTNDGDHFLFADPTQIGVNLKLFVFNVKSQKVVNSFELEENFGNLYLKGDFVYQSKSGGVFVYNMKDKTIKNLISSTKNLYITQSDNFLSIVETESVGTHNFTTQCKLYEVDMVTSNVKEFGKIRVYKDALYMSASKVEGGVLVNVITKDSLFRYNVETNANLKQASLNLSQPLAFYVDITDNVAIFTMKDHAYYYNLKYDNGVEEIPTGSFVRISDEYFNMNDMLMSWENLSAISDYAGPPSGFTPFRTKLFFDRDYFTFSSGDSLIVQRLNRSAPEKVFKYCKSLEMYNVIKYYDNKFYLVNFANASDYLTVSLN